MKKIIARVKLRTYTDEFDEVNLEPGTEDFFSYENMEENIEDDNCIATFICEDDDEVAKLKSDSGFIEELT
tara:strand:- start:1382 stop:1594 length:213 start_codon:yes stop_codon:yes gene_type:complete